VRVSQASDGGTASQGHAVLGTVPLKILLQITVLHVLSYDTGSWVTAVMTSDHHAQQPNHVCVVETSKDQNFSLEVKPKTTTTSQDVSYHMISYHIIQESRAVAGNPRDAAVIFDP